MSVEQTYRSLTVGLLPEAKNLHFTLFTRRPPSPQIYQRFASCQTVNQRDKSGHCNVLISYCWVACAWRKPLQSVISAFLGTVCLTKASAVCDQRFFGHNVSDKGQCNLCDQSLLGCVHDKDQCSLSDQCSLCDQRLLDSVPLTKTNAVCVVRACLAVCMTKTNAVCDQTSLRGQSLFGCVHDKDQCSLWSDKFLRGQSLLGSVHDKDQCSLWSDKFAWSELVGQCAWQRPMQFVIRYVCVIRACWAMCMAKTNAVCDQTSFCVVRACWAVCMTKTSAVCNQICLRDQSLLGNVNDKDQCSLCDRSLLGSVHNTNQCRLCDQTSSAWQKPMQSAWSELVGQCIWQRLMQSV